MIRSTQFWITLMGLAMVSSCVAPPAPIFVQGGFTTVTMEGLAFNPGVVTIKAGTSVQWTNTETSNIPHTVTSGTPEDPNAGILFDSTPIYPGQNFSVTFTAPGTYFYFCKYHFMDGMRDAQIIVTPVR
jgi:plastocyanin